MKKIYLMTIALTMAAGSFAQTLTNPGFEGTIGPHPVYGATYPAIDAVQGWGNLALSASAETTTPGQGLQSLILTNVDDAASAGALGFTGTIVPGYVAQGQTLNGLATAGNMQIDFMYQTNQTGTIDSSGVLVQVYDTIGTDRILYLGTFKITSVASTWTHGTITLASTGETGTNHVLNVRACTSLAFLQNTGTGEPAAGTAGTFIKLDAFTIGFAGITENSKATVKAFPNPTSSVLNITSDEAVKSITVTTMDGKVVATSTTSSVDVAALTSGVYFYEVVTQSGKVAHDNFVKN